MVASFHGLGQQCATHFASEYGRNWSVEEDPDMPAVSGSRPFEVSWHSCTVACRDKCQGIFLPGLLVKVRRQEPTGFIAEKRVDPDRFLPLQVLADDLVG